MMRRLKRLLGVLTLLALVATACGDDAEPADDDAAESTDAGSSDDPVAEDDNGDADSEEPDDDEDDATDGAAKTELILMLNWVPNAHHAGIYLAEANGWYDEVGVDLTIVEPDFSVGVEAAVAQGAADVGIAQAESLLPARAAGVDVVAIATVLPTNDSVLMAAAADGVDGPGSLAGLTYGGFGGALETELVSRLVTCGGGDPSTVEFVEVGEVDYLAGLEQDRFDFVWVFGGWDVLRGTEVEGVDLDIVAFEDHLDCIPDWYTPLVLTAGDRLDDPAVAAFMEATTRGYDAVIEDPAAGAEALKATSPETDPALIDVAVPYYGPRFAPAGSWGAMEADVWTDFADFLLEAGLVEEAVDVDSAWTNELVGG